MRTLAPAPAPVAPRQVVAAGLCIGCGGCVPASGDETAAMVCDRHGNLKPRGQGWVDAPSPSFSRTCPFSPGARDEDELAAGLFPGAPQRDLHIGRFMSAYVGHVEEGGFREHGSSGGMVSWMATELLRRRLVDGVAHVAACDPIAEGRLFRYRVSRSEAEVRAGACSRYYPVDMAEVLRAIRATPGRYAVVGLPCFIKAVNLLRAEDALFRDRIAYTLGLFCGHMKSARFVDSIALQAGVDPRAVGAVEYRVKTPARPANQYRSRLTLADGSVREKDWWHLADGDWGAGFFQNPACNFCDDVVAETADIAFGDAWVEPYASDHRGTNVIVVRRPELDQLIGTAIADGGLALKEVDADFIRRTQAAGLRHRRDGLAWRVRWRPPRLPLRKRVDAGALPGPLRRRLIYRTRYAIAAWSHRMFDAARRSRLPQLYVLWAAIALHLYRALTYSRGRLGRLFDALLGSGPDP